MALNVNIIGKDSEGNLQALKVNSEGNLEISDSLGWGKLLQGISDKLDILVSGTIAEITTLANAISLPPGGKASYNLNAEGAECWLYVNIDKQPWTATANGANTSVKVAGALYPMYVNATKAYPNAAAPACMLYLGHRADIDVGLPAIDDLGMAKSSATPTLKSAVVEIVNNSAETATVTIKRLAIRRWA